ncbi:MAG: hypothetical protein E7602_01040 [Ruminococcaceae bacterium]|nr:hypothetical protein [Oscillospiraceae bacterium]
MKLLLCWIVALVAGIIFLPDYEGGSFRNIPLFIIIVSVALIVTLIKILRYVLFVQKIKKQLIKNGYNVTQTSLVPNLKSSKCYHLSGEKDGKIVNIYIAKRKNSYVTYNFENENKAELYKHTRLTIKPEVRQAYIISPHVDNKKVGEEYFFWSEEDFSENTENILLFKKLPNNVRDTKSSLPLDNGDKINGRVLLFDINGFTKYINN